MLCLKFLPLLVAGAVMLLPLAPAPAQQAGSATNPGARRDATASESHPETGEADLQRGIELTRNGQFTEAIPRLRAADAAGLAGFAGRFNLALCYVATGNYGEGIVRLLALQQSGQETASVDNLLAQAYLGEHDLGRAWSSIQAAIRLSPTNEHLYDFLLDACADHYEYALGLRVATLGTEALPGSQRLHYERAVFLARLDRLGEATPEFTQAVALGKDTYLGHLADVQQRLYGNDLQGALRAARDAVASGHHEHDMLALLGTVLMYTGAAPGQPEFLEARKALESAVSQQPNDSTAQIALGKLYLMDGEAHQAIAHLEIGRRLEPQNAAVYTSLASAYRREGDKVHAGACTQQLARLLREKSAVTAQANGQPD